MDSRRAWWLKARADKLRQPSRWTLCKSDRDVCAEMAESLRGQLVGLPADSIKRVVAVTHMLPFKRMVRHIDDLKWDFFAAFMGSDRLGEVIQADSRVSHVICGHLHRRGVYDIDGIRAIAHPAGYPDEWSAEDFRKAASDSIGVLEIR